MESGSLHEKDAPRQEENMGGRGEAAAEEVEADPRGFHELAFLGKSNAAEAEPELEERDIGPEFDSYEDLAGDKLRLLDRWGGGCVRGTMVLGVTRGFVCHAVLLIIFLLLAAMVFVWGASWERRSLLEFAIPLNAA